jgi:nicotinate-nucleotide adenylyltransferase
LKRFGIFGGTFDPVHSAHLIAAEEVRQQMHLDKVLFVPSGAPPLKETAELAGIADRVEMVRLAINGNDHFELCDIEAKAPAGTKTYTVDTLLSLRERYKDEAVKFYLVIGMDQLIALDRWKDPGKLFMLSEVVAINRPGYLVQQIENEYSRQVVYVPIPSIEISSSDIRFRIKENRSVKYLVPEAVENYIIENQLYKL